MAERRCREAAASQAAVGGSSPLLPACTWKPTSTTPPLCAPHECRHLSGQQVAADTLQQVDLLLLVLRVCHRVCQLLHQMRAGGGRASSSRFVDRRGCKEGLRPSLKTWWHGHRVACRSSHACMRAESGRRHAGTCCSLSLKPPVCRACKLAHPQCVHTGLTVHHTLKVTGMPADKNLEERTLDLPLPSGELPAGAR